MAENLDERPIGTQFSKSYDIVIVGGGLVGAVAGAFDTLPW